VLIGIDRKHLETMLYLSYDEVRSYPKNNQSALETAMQAYGFTDCRQITQGEVTFQIEPHTKLSPQSTPLGLLFASQKPKRELQIQSEKLIISDFAYEGMEKFLDQFQTYWKIISPIIGLSEPIHITKVGLRKINSINIEPVLLFNLARSGLLVKDAFKITEETAVLEQNNQVCILKTRLQNKGEKSLEAHLDFDLVSLSATNFEQAFSQILPSLNQFQFNLFMWAVTDEMIQLMEN